MNERVGVVETTLGDVVLTQIAGSSSIVDRRLLQVGDGLLLDRQDAIEIAHALLAWAIGAPVPDYERDDDDSEDPEGT